MAKIMKSFALVSTGITVLLAAWYIHSKNSLALTLMITFGTISYHFIMRLLVGAVIQRLLNNHVNHRRRWFQVGAAEQKLYKTLKVKKWKGKMGTYDPDAFDRKLHSWEEIVQATCQAELVHEIIIPLSFLPLLASILFGELWVFLITSVLAACFDAMFVMIQRFNRPRIIKLTEKI